MIENSLNSALSRIAGLAQSRRLDAAAQLAEQTLQGNPRDPVLLALAGAIEFYRGQFGRAAEHLDLALQLKPEDLTVRANLAESLFRCGKEAEALALCDDRSAVADPSLRLARLGAALAQNAGEFDRAARNYRHIVDRNPEDWAAWNNLGNVLCDLGDHEAAADALARAVTLAPDSGPIRLNLGNALIEAGRHDEAEAALNEMVQLFPGDPQPLLSLFTFFKLSGQDEKAYDAIFEAARRAPESADIQSDLGQEAAAANLYDVAEQAFERALSLNPKLGPPYVGLASLYERMNREALLDPLRDRAITSGADGQTLSLIDALRFKRSENFDAAFAALEDAGDVIVAGRKHHLRGIMLDRLGQYDEAFDAFSQMNRHWLENPSLPGERGRQYREMVRACRDLVSPEWLAGWAPANPPMTRSTPVFLAGFPRSGTTLLDTMLMADPDVRVLEEENFIAELEAEIGGPEALPAMTEAQVAGARERYFERVGKIVDLGPQTRIIDKHPLYLNKVPVIRRLFPEARFILALRHPCDVLLSCFITNFRANHGMASFLELETAAELYDLSFAYWEKMADLANLEFRTVVYERLIENSGRELKPVFDWLGLHWPGDTHDHRDAARNRGVVRTASYSQVTEPLYKRAMGRWVRYKQHLEPVFPAIEPWVKRFGYDLHDGRIPDWPDAQQPEAGMPG